jgi:hypothetical protein
MHGCLTEWAARWRVPEAALDELRQGLLGMIPEPAAVPGGSEAAVQTRVRVAASRHGMRLWRNNVGAVHDPETGVHIRFGLCNDSPQINAVVKSADLIGIRPRVIQPGDIGHTVGQFVSLEVKHSGWKWPVTPSERELAQQRWAALVTSLGGEARFISDESLV